MPNLKSGSKIFLSDTLSGEKKEFVPIETAKVSMYNCGPTVYDYAHIGNLRSYIFADTLRRMFEYNDYSVKQVINITDMGHLSGNADDGEDKMTKALKREGKPMTLEAMREVANFYFEKFKEDLNSLNIKTPEYFPFASDHVKEFIELIEKLIDKDYTYVISDGIYFDTSKFPNYGKLGGLNEEQISRIGVNPEKKNSRDFALWKFNKDLGYEAPFGKGFPGWHIECSVMSQKYLGQPFDIHTGGIDHIPIHHNDEIAQSEAAYNTPLANYWLHNAFLTINENRMSKSESNFITLNTLKEKGFDPIALRYFYLTAHYSSPVKFSWKALDGAQNALKGLRERVSELKEGSNEKYKEEFIKLINDDLGTPKALALIWEMVKEGENKNLILEFDKILGLKLDEHTSRSPLNIPEEVRKLVEERDKARLEKDFAKSDGIRIQIESQGFEVMDTAEGTIVIKE